MTNQKTIALGPRSSVLSAEWIDDKFLRMLQDAAYA